jgi:hypothetical protein
MPILRSRLLSAPRLRCGMRPDDHDRARGAADDRSGDGDQFPTGCGPGAVREGGVEQEMGNERRPCSGPPSRSPDDRKTQAERIEKRSPAIGRDPARVTDRARPERIKGDPARWDESVVRTWGS